MTVMAGHGRYFSGRCDCGRALYAGTYIPHCPACFPCPECREDDAADALMSRPYKFKWPPREESK
jgi:hypothetical protein